LRLIDFYIAQLKVQGPSRTCNESKEEEEYAVNSRVFETNTWRDEMEKRGAESRSSENRLEEGWGGVVPEY